MKQDYYDLCSEYVDKLDEIIFKDNMRVDI